MLCRLLHSRHHKVYKMRANGATDWTLWWRCQKCNREWIEQEDGPWRWPEIEGGAVVAAKEDDHWEFEGWADLH